MLYEQNKTLLTNQKGLTKNKNKIRIISIVMTPEIFKIESILKPISTPNHNEQVGLTLIIPGQCSTGKSINIALYITG